MSRRNAERRGRWRNSPPSTWSRRPRCHSTSAPLSLSGPRQTPAAGPSPGSTAFNQNEGPAAETSDRWSLSYIHRLPIRPGWRPRRHRSRTQACRPAQVRTPSASFCRPSASSAGAEERCPVQPRTRTARPPTHRWGQLPLPPLVSYRRRQPAVRRRCHIRGRDHVQPRSDHTRRSEYQRDPRGDGGRQRPAGGTDPSYHAVSVRSLNGSGHQRFPLPETD